MLGNLNSLDICSLGLALTSEEELWYREQNARLVAERMRKQLEAWRLDESRKRSSVDPMDPFSATRSRVRESFDSSSVRSLADGQYVSGNDYGLNQYYHAASLPANPTTVAWFAMINQTSSMPPTWQRQTQGLSSAALGRAPSIIDYSGYDMKRYYGRPLKPSDTPQVTGKLVD